MTIQEAMKAAQAIFPGDGSVSISIEFVMRASFPEGKVEAIRWIHSSSLSRNCVSSERSWEHVLAKAKADNEDAWEDVAENMDEVIA